MITTEQARAMNDEQRAQAVAHSLRTVERLLRWARTAKTARARAQLLRDARYFLADARRVRRCMRSTIKVDTGARASYVRSEAQYKLDRSIEASELWIDRAARRARAAEVA